MTDSTRLLLSVDDKTIKQIDKIVKALNENIEYYRRKTNRQGVIKGLIKFALEQDVQYARGYSKHVEVQHKK